MKVRGISYYDYMLLLFVGGVIVLSFPANLLRVWGVPFFRGPYYDVIFVIFVVLALCNLWMSKDSPLPSYYFAATLLLFSTMVFAIGVIRGNENVIAGMKYFALPLIVYMLLVGRRFVLSFYSSNFLWSLVVGSHVFCLLFYYAFLYGRVYPGIGVPSISFAALFFLAKQKYFLLSVSLLVVLLEGKRSLLLALLITMVFMRMVRLSVVGRLIYTILGIGILVLSMYLGLSFLAGITGSAIVNRINLLNPFSGSFDILLGSSGRAGELLSYFRGKDTLELLIGSGSGFTYEWQLGYASTQEGEIKGYFHMTPANYLAAGGLLGLVPFVWMMLLPFRAGALKESNDTRTVAFGLGVFCVVQSFFGFNLATDAVSIIFIIGPMMLLSEQRRPGGATALRSNSLERTS